MVGQRRTFGLDFLEHIEKLSFKSLREVVALIEGSIENDECAFAFFLDIEQLMYISSNFTSETL